MSKKLIYDFTKTSTNELLKLVKQNWSRLQLSRDILQGGTKKRAHWQNRLAGASQEKHRNTREGGFSRRTFAKVKKILGRYDSKGKDRTGIGGDAPDYGVLYPGAGGRARQLENTMSEGIKSGMKEASKKVHSFARSVRQELAPQTAAQVRELRRRGVDIKNVKPDPMASQAKRLKKQYYQTLRTGTRKKKPY